MQEKLESFQNMHRVLNVQSQHKNYEICVLGVKESFGHEELFDQESARYYTAQCESQEGEVYVIEKAVYMSVIL